MTKQTHTPGPWVIGYGGQEGDSYAVITSPHSKRAICNLEPLDYVHENAVLISAAPDLLAACEELVAEFEEKFKEDCLIQGHYGIWETYGIMLARESIAKARGEGVEK